jgi:hypothetical protein
MLIVAFFAANVTSISVDFGGTIMQWRSSTNLTQLMTWKFAGIFGSLSVGPVKPMFSEGPAVYILSLITFLFVSSKLYRVVTEAADALGIYVFKVDKKQKKVV